MGMIESGFSEDEWNTVVSSPMLVAMAVTMADPSGLWGLVKESAAGARGLADAKTSGAGGPIAQKIVAAFETAEGRKAARDSLREDLKSRESAELKAQVLSRLDKAVSAVEARAPEQAQAYKSWLMSTAERVAESAKEGGFLGFGGVAVSDQERATLDELRKRLG